MEKGKMVAKLKFWFGFDIKDLFSDKYIIEQVENYVYVYEVTKDD